MMRSIPHVIAFLLLILLVACGTTPDGGLPFFQPAATATLPGPNVTITSPPDAEAAVRAFLSAWKSEQYAVMYDMLTTVSQNAISKEDFITRYKEAMAAMSLESLDYEILSVLTNPYTAEVAFRVTYHTVLIGDLEREMVARLDLEDGLWRIQWDDGLILPELSGGNKLAMDYRIPARGNIYDRDGDPLAAQADAVALGIIPGQIKPKQEGALVSVLSRLTGVPASVIRASYANAAPDWYIPVGEISAEEFQRNEGTLTSLAGLSWTPYQARYYYDGGVAAQTVGYVITVPAEELDEYRRRGYSGSEKVGYAGIEKWGEPYLAGKHGGALYVVDSQGQIVTRLAASDPEPAQSIYLTIDKDFQKRVEAALSGFRGAIVVLERDTGRVLAMASSPSFDPNLFDPANPNNVLLTDLLSDPQQPLVNRATQGQYPLGSVFKIITFSAALETGAYTPDTTYDCQYEFTEIPGHILYDWTWDHCQQELRTEGECKTQPSGELTLIEGLMRSCNPYFWHIGLDLYNRGFKTAVTDMARSFGLGQPTGIEQVAEASGNIVDPTDGLMAVNEAIGQDPILVTPLQVATFIAAIGNGGTLYRPQLVERIETVDGETALTFKPEARGTLPLSPETLNALREAMIAVVKNPRGTAHYRLRGLIVPVAGKTGTAESGIEGQPHAWFAGYTYDQETGLPDIAVVVILENAGEGADYAAPIFKRVVESYFFGSPQSVYWWESAIGVTRTPTPEGGIPTKTPKGGND